MVGQRTVPVWDRLDEEDLRLYGNGVIYPRSKVISVSPRLIRVEGNQYAVGLYGIGENNEEIWGIPFSHLAAFYDYSGINRDGEVYFATNNEGGYVFQAQTGKYLGYRSEIQKQAT